MGTYVGTKYFDNNIKCGRTHIAPHHLTLAAMGRLISFRYALKKQIKRPNRFKGGKLDVFVNISLQVLEMVQRQNVKWFHILKQQQQDTASGKTNHCGFYLHTLK